MQITVGGMNNEDPPERPDMKKIHLYYYQPSSLLSALLLLHLTGLLKHLLTMAYGSIPPPSTTTELPIVAYSLPNGSSLTCFPVTGQSASIELCQFLCGVFNEELASESCFGGHELCEED
jgi:hypothetical protein